MRWLSSQVALCVAGGGQCASLNVLKRANHCVFTVSCIEKAKLDCFSQSNAGAGAHVVPGYIGGSKA